MKKRKRVDMKKLLTRIVIWAIVILTVLGSTYMAIYFMFHKRALQNPEVESAAGARYPENLYIRAALSYNTATKTGVQLKTDAGFQIGLTDSTNSFTKLYTVTNTSVSVLCDANMVLSGSEYIKASSSAATTVGGYHIQLKLSDTDIFGAVTTVSNSLSGLYAFPALVGSKYAIRAGSFASSSAATAALANYKSAYPDATVVGPSETGLTVVDHATGKILFEYDVQVKSNNYNVLNGLKYLSLLPVSSGNTASCTTYAGYRYEGFMRLRRWGKTAYGITYDGVEVVNYVPLEKYVMGVLPYEVGNSWPAESLKAFSIDVRTFAITHLNSLKAYLCDVDNTTNYQVYRGTNNVNKNVTDCVNATKGEILTYNGAAAQVFYCSSMGGVRANVADVWGGSSYPYLTAIATPWEKYSTRSSGAWKVEFTPAELTARLREKGYSIFTGNIASITINEVSANSSYVKQITITDVNGNSRTFNNTDTIRNLFGLKSANFVVGKAGSTVQETVYSLQGYDGTSANAGNRMPTTITMQHSSETFTASANSEIYAMTTSGKALIDTSSGIWFKTATGVNKLETYHSSSLPVTSHSGLLDFSKLPTIVSTKSVTLSGTSGSFVFSGKGYGHGVGSSQYGYYDLAQMGYYYEEIISFYYRGTVIKNYTSIT